MVTVQPSQNKNYYPSLDGWRGIAIICVLLAHWFPLGPKNLQLNSMFGLLGMSLFFPLSGFLITNILLKRPQIKSFLIRRLFRIIPLAYLYLIIVLPLMSATLPEYTANFLFYANLPPFWLTAKTSHFWSLCLEVQFYLVIAGITYFFKQRGLFALPILCLAVTCMRILFTKTSGIETIFRVDEILAGASLGLIYHQKLGTLIPKFLKWVNPYIIVLLLLASCHEYFGVIMYLRPYFAMILVGSMLYQNQRKLYQYLTHPMLKYIATISYAVYIIHPITAYGWMDSGNKVIKYLIKRPISLALCFGLAHLSTFYYEKYWISLGKKLSKNTEK